MPWTRIVIAGIAVAVAVVLLFAGVSGVLSLERLKTERVRLETFVADRPFQAGVLFFALYILVAGLALPGAVILTLAGGALFGFLPGLVLVSFASTMGACLGFLMSRFLLRDLVQRRFGAHLRAINDGVATDGSFYLFVLRLVPILPFFLVNVLMGLTPLNLSSFYWVSQVGMFPATAIYVNAGVQLGSVHSVDDVLSPGLILSLALLGIFPLVARRAVRAIRAKRRG